MRFRTPMILVSAGLFSLASLKLFAVPYLWAFLSVAVASLLLMQGCRIPWVRAFWLNLAVAVIVLGGAEAFFWNGVRHDRTPTYSPQGYQVRDDVLGAAPVKGITARARLADGETTVYDVAYSIGADGLRTPPPVGNAQGSVIFFGCSFTFGEGLNDEQVMPYRVGILAEGRYQTRNFGFHGYGAQQMLSSLERGHLDALLDRPPTHFIYQAIPDHVARAVGLHDYQFNHPRFVLQRDGSVVRKGLFSDAEDAQPPPSALALEIRWQLGKSYTYSRLLTGERQTNDQDLQLWLAIVEQSKRHIEAKYPNAEFHVLMWPWANWRTPAEEALGQEMTRRLVNLGVRVHSIADMLPNYDEQPEPYQLSPTYDRHPSAAANDLIARYVVREILGARATR
jgi:hypothetical protein